MKGILEFLAKMSNVIFTGAALSTAGVVVTFLSFFLTIFTKWETIKHLVKGEIRQAKRQVLSAAYCPLLRQIPALHVPEDAYPASNSPKSNIFSLIGDLFFNLVKTMLAIGIAVAISAEYLLITVYAVYDDTSWLLYEPFWVPIVMFLMASLLLGSIVGAYLRVYSGYSIVLISILSQIGFLVLLILALSDWNLVRVENMLRINFLKLDVQSMIEATVLALRQG
jgi:hypothetical protein